MILATRKVSGVSSQAPGPRARNRRGQGDRLRADILTAAANILDETGDEQAVTLRAVARRVGIAAPSIYGHFPDRQAILLAIVREAFADLAEQLSQAAAADSGDQVARLYAICDAYLDFASTHPQRYRVMFGGLWSAAEAVRDGALSETEAAELGLDSLRLVADSLDRCVKAGHSASTDVLADAVALWVGLHGLAHQRSLALEFPWPPDIAARLIDALARLRSTVDR